MSTHRTDGIVTNDHIQHSAAAVPQGCGYRWKIEQLHREGKQVNGLKRCQYRKTRIQRNPIASAFGLGTAKAIRLRPEANGISIETRETR